MSEENVPPPVTDGDRPMDRALSRTSSGLTERYVAGTHLAGLNSALALGVPQSPAFKVLVGLERHPSLAAIDAVLTASQVAKTFDIPAITNWSAVLGKQFRSLDLMNAIGIGRQLTQALDVIGPQRAALNATLAGLGNHQNLFAGQVAQIISSQDAISRVALGADLVKSTALFDSIGRYGQVQATLGALVTTERTTLLRGLTRAPSRRYDSYLDGLPARPIARRAAVATFGGDAQSGMLIAESLTALGLDDDGREELTEQYTVEVFEPWQAGPARARNDLFDALAAVRSDLPDWLKAAWDDIERDGPKAASKIANCTVECIDQTLRIVAAVDDVLAWIADVGERPGWMHGGRPTRRAKVMFVMRHRSKRDARLAVSQVEALATLVNDVVDDLQSVKHGPAPSIAVMRGMVQAAEGALSQLLLHY
jgi:hypothetical protein